MSKSQKPNSRWTEGKAPATLDEFCLCLEASRVLTADEARQFAASLPEAKRPQTPKALATELVKAGKLTRLQAQSVLQGKIKYLSFGEYVILEKLGQGGMGQVLKAQHRRMLRTVALKVISNAAMKDADAVKRFQREVHAAARLIHPNIVTAFDANEHQGVHFFVMEYVEGKDLNALVRDQGPLPVATAVNYVLQAARGLAYAHGKGIVHRDIKPANLLVDSEGTVKILDMGLARVDLGADGGQELTNTGQVMGTVDYMAPEQAEDTHSVDARADIYSLGCTLYRVLSGDVLYSGESVMKKLLAHRGAPIPTLGSVCADVPAALENTFRKMVAKRPEDRQPNMTQVVAELEAILRDLPSSPTLGSTEVTTDLKLSDLPSSLTSRSGKSPATATAHKSLTKPTAATEITQEFSAGDTSVGWDKAAAAAGPPQPGVRNHVPRYILIATALAALALAAIGIVIFLPTGAPRSTPTAGGKPASDASPLSVAADPTEQPNLVAATAVAPPAATHALDLSSKLPLGYAHVLLPIQLKPSEDLTVEMYVTSHGYAPGGDSRGIFSLSAGGGIWLKQTADRWAFTASSKDTAYDEAMAPVTLHRRTTWQS